MVETAQLRLDSVDFSVKGLQILTGVSFDVFKGELLALIGPNGAGKTSLLNCISGIYRLTGGQILLEGENIGGLRSHEVAEVGIARTFQNVEIFQNMSVLENLLVGRHLKIKSNTFWDGFFLGRAKEQEIKNRESIEKIIEFLELEKFRNSDASSLAYGLQKIVGLGRALAMEPKVLLLDEPSAGMNREEKEDLARFILRVKYEIGITMIWVEHDMQLVGDLADKIVVLNFGHVLAKGAAKDVLNNPQVINAYLGTSVSKRESALCS